MKRIGCIIFILATVFVGMPQALAADGFVEADMQVASTPAPVITVSGQTVRVTNAEGLCLEVFSITGAKVSSVAIDANDKSITLNVPRGWYIVRVGSATRKIAIG